MASRSVPARVAWVGLVDLVAVSVFVAIGRSVHGHGLSVAGFASTAWPFLTGLALSWLAFRVVGRAPVSLLDGVAVSVGTVAVGMALRVVAGQGTAVAFVLVALSFLATLLLAGRLLAWLAGRRRTRRRVG